MLKNIKGNFGFGCMRLPMNGEEVNTAEFSKMIDTFFEGGFNYFDTAHCYLDGKSETALKECLTSRYNREDYILADKLSDWLYETREDILPLFEKQLAACGVEYFDFYLFHAVHKGSYPKYKNTGAFKIVSDLKAKGKVKHIAMSFHDTADVLDMILTEQPEIEAVQLQLNYLDFDDPTVQSQKCYEIAVKHGKKVLVMEPVRGGALVNLPKEAEDEFSKLGGSPVSYALRYAASYPEVFMVLSGMGNMEMMTQNIKTMNPFIPLSKEETAACDRVREIIRKYRQIPCTGCNYCADLCPLKMPISGLFGAYNKYVLAKEDKDKTKETILSFTPSVSSCTLCGKCETVCPQNIKIRENLKKVTKILGE